MKASLLGAFGALLLVFGIGGAVLADPPLEQGIPGTPECVGQTMAFLAQLAKNGGPVDPEFKGIGGISRAGGRTPAEIHQAVVAFCAGEL